MSDIRKQIFNKLLMLGTYIKDISISDLIKNNDHEKSIIKSDLLNFDYSKQRINAEALDYLLQIPDLINLKDSLEALFRGQVRNPSEDRAVSHTLYRDKKSTKNFESIFTERERIRSFLEKSTSILNFKNLIYLGLSLIHI